MIFDIVIHFDCQRNFYRTFDDFTKGNQLFDSKVQNFLRGESSNCFQEGGKMGP